MFLEAEIFVLVLNSMIFKFGETSSIGTRNELGVQQKGVSIKGEDNGWSLRETCYVVDRQKKGRNYGYRPSEEFRILVW